jgi:hypothetical protein
MAGIDRSIERASGPTDSRPEWKRIGSRESHSIFCMQMPGRRTDDPYETGEQVGAHRSVAIARTGKVEE